MSATPPTWTPERIDELRRLFEAGRSCSEIAREISVTRNAVIGKLSRLGLSRPQVEAGRRSRSDGPKERLRRSPWRILATLQAEAELPTADEQISGAHRCSLLDVSPRNCRWPIGHPGADDFGFCGNAAVAGLPYCPGHARIAYQPAGRRHVAASGGR